jgi:predicted P-loop ATPase/GTPase
MEQELMDFDEWIKTVEIVEEEYFAEYDDAGNIVAIFCNHGYHNETVKRIKIDSDIAMSFHEGTEHIHHYKINVLTKELTKLDPLSSQRMLVTIDDVLHRIIDENWSDIEDPDITVVYNNEEKQLEFSINNCYNGLILSGDTEMTFHVTEYNDPNIMKQIVTFRVGDLLEGSKIFKTEVDGKFSVYTRRIFEKYVFRAI